MKSLNRCLVILGFAVVVADATAQTTNVILTTDYDGDAGEGNFNSSYGYCVAGSSSGNSLAGESGGITSGVGVGGTFANSITADYTLLPSDPAWTNAANTYNYAVLGNGTQFGSPITAITPTAVTGSFVLSADLQVVGLLPQLNSADVTVSKVQFMDGSANVIFDFTGDAGFVGSNYVHISVPLSSLGYAADSTHPITDLTNAAVVSAIASFTIEFAVNGLPVGVVGGQGANIISPPFGFADAGVLNVDNITLVQTGNTVPTPVQEHNLVLADFDTTFPAAVYGFSFRDGANNATGMTTTNIGGGVNGSDSLEYALDLSSWSGTPPAVFSGFGVGADFLPVPGPLTASDKSAYRVYFSAKAGGLPATSAPNIPAVMDLLFLVPAGAESPSNPSPAVVFDLNPSLTLTTNWQSFVFDGSACPVGVNNGGSQALFDQYVSQVNELKVQVATEGSPDIGAQFGYGTNVTIDIDNIKVVQLFPATPPVTVVETGGHLEVLWADPTTGGTAQLLSSTNAAGPYVAVSGADSGAASPYPIPAGSSHRFFRTVWVP